MENTLLEELYGAWQLVFWRIEYDSLRPPDEPFGSDPQGLLLYERSGWMSATMSTRQRTALSAASAAVASVASKAVVLDEYLAYCGRWRLDGNVVVHDVLCSLNPVLIGTEQRREATFTAGFLDLTAVETERSSGANKSRRHRIRWRRR